jgi:hypothetical protein
MAERPLSNVLGFRSTQSVGAWENMVREALTHRRSLTVVEAFEILDGNAARFSPAVAKRTGALLTLFGYVDHGDGIYVRRAQFSTE